ncbi:MAG: glycosyltransferase, partial [Candidatus Hydrogenedentes bacterium]|nr:glycosyltransferase [Candidatus Hydrogenedentota bacterium]
MNVLHLDEQLGWRGGEQQASWLIQGTVKKGHRVWITGKANSPFLTAEHGGVELQRIPAPFWNEVDPISIWKLAELVHRQEIDILHAHTSHAHMIACLVRVVTRRPSVVVSRRVSFEPKTDPINRWKYRAPDRLLAVSERVAEVLRAGGIPPEKVVRVYSSIEMERLDVEPADRDEFGISDDTALLFNAGALVGHKDHATLLATLALLRRTHPNIHL